MSPLSFSATSYNLLAQAYVRPDRYRGVDPAALEATARRARVLDRVAALDSDVLCLQEVEPAVFEALQQRLDGFEGRLALKTGRPEGCAIFVRRARFSIERVRPLRYDAGDKDSLALIAELSTRPDSRPIGVVCTHLQWQPPRTARHRHVGRLQLLELVAAIEDRPGSWLLTGDLNAISESVVLQAAHERGWRLSCRQQRPWDTAAINGRTRKLDYLLYRADQLVPTPGALPELRRGVSLPTLSEPSDHLPVTVRFVFAAA